MTEKLSNLPIGAREDDLGELNDYTIQDIATAEKTSPEDRKNAEVEIAARIAAGTYDPDNAPHASRSDLLSHGYSVEDGKILYPKPEYKAWLKSDRKLTPPTGIYRETIEDRAEALQDSNRSLGETALQITLNNQPVQADLDAPETPQEAESIEEYEEYDIYDHLPGVEKFPHSAKSPTEKSQRLKAYNDHKINSEIEIDSRRKFKNHNKYDNIYLNQEKIDAAEARGNLPIVETTKPSPESMHNPEAFEDKSGQLYNVYAENFPKNAPKWISFGVSSSLEKGIINPPIDSLLRSGFWAREESKIHERLDPENTFTDQTIDAEASLKTRVSKDLIDKKAQSIKNEEIKDAVKYGILYAINSGAHTDKRTGKIIYALPVDKSPDLLKYMEDSGIKMNSPEVKLASYEGFINILEEIKNNQKEAKQGFKVLDWYFDNFDYTADFAEPDGFLDILEGYKSTSDLAWANKLDEYLQTRPEYLQYIKEMNSPEQHIKDVESIERAVPIPHEDIIKNFSKILGIPKEALEDISLSAHYILGPVLPPEPTIKPEGSSSPDTSPSYNYPKTFGKQKILTMYATYALLRASGKDFNAEIFQEVDKLDHINSPEADSPNLRERIKIGKEKYTILRFGCENSYGIKENHAIAEGDAPASATYIWHGQGDGWKQALINQYKRDAKKYPGVSTKNHDHSKSPIDHMINIMANMGIDLIELANQVIDQLAQPKTPDEEAQ